MRDAVSIARVKDLHPAVSAEVFETIGQIEALWPSHVAIRIVQGLRTIKEQDALYAQGRTAPGKIVTKAKGGSSFHNYGLAFDFALIFDQDNNGSFETLSWDENNPYWKQVVKAFEAKGWFWGGNFSSIHDAPHLEKKFGKTWQNCLAMYNAKEFIPGTEFIRI